MSEHLIISLHTFINEIFAYIVIAIALGGIAFIKKWIKSINVRFDNQQKCLDNLSKTQNKQSKAIKRLSKWLDHKRSILHPKNKIESIEPQIDELLK